MPFKRRFQAPVTRALLGGALLASAFAIAPAGAAPHNSSASFIQSSASQHDAPDPDYADASESWPQIGYDAGHSGYTPKEKALSTANVAGLTQLWDEPTGGYPLGLVASSTTLYGQSTDGNLYALNPATGAVRWKQAISNPGQAPAPVVTGNIVISGCGSAGAQGMCAFNAKTGKPLYSQLCSQFACEVAASPTLSQGLVYWAIFEGPTYSVAMNAKTGTNQWSTTSPNHCYGSTFGNAVPVANGLVYIPQGCLGQSQNTTGICAYNATTGNSLWCTLLTASAGILGTSVVGTRLYGNAVGNGVPWPTYEINASNGHEIWAQNPAPNNNSEQVQPAVADGLMIESIDGVGVEAFSSKTGAAIWVQSSAYSENSSVTIANGVAYTTCGGGYLCALDEKTGAILWTGSSNSGAAKTTPIVLNGILYGACNSNDFCAYGLPGNKRR